MDTLFPNRGDPVSLPDLKRDAGALIRSPSRQAAGGWIRLACRSWWP